MYDSKNPTEILPFLCGIKMYTIKCCKCGKTWGESSNKDAQRICEDCI